MKCPNCGAVYDDGCRFCGACGTPLITEKKGTHRVPILIMLALSILGICVFFATGGRLSAEPPQWDGDLYQDYDDQPYFIERGALSANSAVLWGQAEITVPDTVNGQTVTAIDDSGFSGFPHMHEIHLPDTVTAIGSHAFHSCITLRGIALPPAVTTIGDYAFLYCDELEAIHIPDTVEEIGENAFQGCSSLAFIFYDGTIDQWKAIYDQELPADTAVCCADGTFRQDN